MTGVYKIATACCTPANAQPVEKVLKCAQKNVGISYAFKKAILPGKWRT